MEVKTVKKADINEAIKQLTKKAKAINFVENGVFFLMDNGLYILTLLENPVKNGNGYIGFLDFNPINGRYIRLYDMQTVETTHTKEELINQIFE
jgi:hypothetical protein